MIRLSRDSIAIEEGTSRRGEGEAESKVTRLRWAGFGLVELVTVNWPGLVWAGLGWAWVGWAGLG